MPCEWALGHSTLALLPAGAEMSFASPWKTSRDTPSPDTCLPSQKGALCMILAWASPYSCTTAMFGGNSERSLSEGANKGRRQIKSLQGHFTILSDKHPDTVPSTCPIIFTLPSRPWVLLAPHFCWCLHPLLPSSPSSSHCLSSLKGLAMPPHPPHSLSSLSFFFSFSSRVPFSKGCPGRLGRLKTF